MPLPARQRLLAPLIAAAALLAVAVAPAGAQVAPAAFAPCTAHKNFECATVTVPLDRTGQVPGTVPLHVERERGTGDRSTVWIGLAGGPGQSSASLAESEWRGLAAPVAAADQVVVFDQRGTGQSGLVDCSSAFRGARSALEAGTLCGDRLGAARPFYTTTDSIQDIDAVREAVGASTVVLVGVSYGTYVALRYARAYPDRVAALVLDSTVPLADVDQWNTATFQAIPRILGDLCTDGACPFTNNPAADLKTVAQRMQASPQGGPFVFASGRVVNERIGPAQTLYGALINSDFNPQTRAFFPGAVAAAKRGDWAPVVRLVGLSEGASESPSASAARAAFASASRDTEDEADESQGVLLATSCTDIVTPWAPSAPLGGRSGLLASATGKLSSRTFSPFPIATVRASSTGAECLGWPATNATPFVDSGAPLAVPTLLLSGGADLRTPTADAAATQALIPGSTLVVTPGTGHFVLGNDLTGCGLEAYQRFLAGQPVGDPCTGKKLVPVTRPRPPLKLAEVTPYGASGTTGRVARAGLTTLSDALASLSLAATGSGPTKIGGLRAGRVKGQPGSGSARVTLAGDVYVPGVKVSGTVTITATTASGTLKVDGGRASRRGTLALRGASVSGTIGGRRVHSPATAGASAARAAWAPAYPLLRGPGVDIG